MLRFTSRVTVFLALLAIAVSPLVAQTYPKPGPASGPPVLCTSCQGQYANLPTWPYSSPIKAHAGRFLDSSGVKDYQGPIPRTYRAWYTVVAPERNRVYMVVGSTFGSYKLDQFFTSKLTQPLAHITRQKSDGSMFQADGYLPFDSKVDAEETASGWQTFFADGQERLYHFDYDDRGFVYLAYSTYGWGIVRDDGSPNLPLVSQRQTRDQAVTATRVVSLKSGSNYYALVGDSSSPDKSLLYDVTNASDPVLIRTVSTGFISYAKTDTTIALVTRAPFPVQIWNVADFVAARAPVATFPGPFVSVTSDGVNYFAVEKIEDLKISTFARTGATFVETRHNLGVRFASQSIRFGGANFLTVGGYDSTSRLDAKIFRVDASLAPREIPLGSFFPHYYGSPPAGYARPSGYMISKDAVMHTQGGKDYLFFSAFGLGDVYEIQSRDSISVDIVRSGYGTDNPYSTTRGQGPFYGDLFTFTSSATGAAVGIRWNFGNPEAGSSNTVDKLTGETVTHRFVALTSAAALVTPKGVSAAVTTDPTNTASINVQLVEPKARLALRDGPALSAISSGLIAPIVAGDQFVDASDGTVEGHFTSWSIDSVSPTRLPPSTPFNVGPCGNHLLTMEARYVPYTAGGGVIVPALPDNAHFVSALRVFNYRVRPFVALVQLGSSDASTVSFRNISRTAAASVFTGGAGTAIVAKWNLLNAAGASIATKSTTLTVGTLSSDTYTVQKAQIVAGSSVTLELSMAASGISDAGCAQTTFLTSSDSVTLSPPDPVITLVSGCVNAGTLCSLSAGSVSIADQTSWTYEWRVNGAPAGNSATLSTTFPNAGAYTVTLSASNAVGLTTVDRIFNVQQSACVGAPRSVSISYTGSTTGCTTCTTNEPLQFTPRSFGYSFQACDSFLWNFGDGATSSARAPIHTFAGNGPFTVTLAVTNSNGTAPTATATISFGVVIPPDTCRIPGGFVSPGFRGDASGCTATNPTCSQGEAIRFLASTFSYVLQDCDILLWDFGDGRSSNVRAPVYSYDTAGAYTVTLTVQNRAGTSTPRSTPLIVNPVAPPQTCTTPPVGFIYFSYFGGTSLCDNTANSTCQEREEITLDAKAFNYGFQSCDEFEWDFGDGTARGTGRQAKHRYFASGSYNVTLTVRNRNGNKASAPSRINVAPQGGTQIPIPTITSSADTGFTGIPITFTGIATPADGITAWNWTFGDGTSGSGAVVTHTFATVGTFEVKLTVNKGAIISAPTTRTIAIAESPQLAFLLPVVAHVPGSNGSRWRTDLQILNNDPEFSPSRPLILTFSFKGQEKTLSLGTSTYIHEDFLRFFKDGDDAGPVTLRVNSRIAPQIWTRTYNQSATGVGTFGQRIPAIALSTTPNPNSAETLFYLSGLSFDRAGRYRTNLGIVNPNLARIVVKVVVLDDRNLELGSFEVPVDPFQLVQVNDLDVRVPRLPKTRPFSVLLSNAAGNSIIGYASMIDNISNDPVFFPGVSEQETKGLEKKTLILPGVGHISTWRSDVTLFNPDSRTAQVDLTYFGQDGTQLATAKDLLIPSNSFLQYNDILTAGLLLPTPPDSFGLLRVETKSAPVAKYPLVIARTYSDQGDAGTFGQGIPAFASSQGNASTNKPAFIAGVRSDTAYQTNLFIVGLGTTPSRIRVALLDSASGASIGSREFSVNPNQSLSFPNAIRELHQTAATGALKIEVISGDPVWAFASQIDRLTKDPEYIPAVPVN